MSVDVVRDVGLLVSETLRDDEHRRSRRGGRAPSGPGPSFQRYPGSSVSDEPARTGQGVMVSPLADGNLGNDSATDHGFTLTI